MRMASSIGQDVLKSHKEPTIEHWLRFLFWGIAFKLQSIKYEE
ncbi:hypothetical protein CGH68_01570 [Vibrio parahaemolyticus]|nr:hypothetical protein CGH68_01570 [Vibrio parahaemolyticus]